MFPSSLALGLLATGVLHSTCDCHGKEQEGDMNSLLQLSRLSPDSMHSAVVGSLDEATMVDLQQAEVIELKPPSHPPVNVTGNLSSVAGMPPPAIDYDEALTKDVPSVARKMSQGYDLEGKPDDPVLLPASYWIDPQRDGKPLGDGNIYAYITTSRGLSYYTPVQYAASTGYFGYPLKVPFGQDIQVELYHENGFWFDHLVGTVIPDMGKPLRKLQHVTNAVYALNYFVFPSDTVAAWEMLKMGMCPRNRCRIYLP
eukprot:TRINITY_DN26760_c0_g1_i1.p1 TRINITY_DN26760_c0_g1~~TRINITY_DN26760_c0_g1_i1.p1  ORF type:complete len:281 (+),score=33.48 TRINITY_DN26760_c0_g1_i1:78-845(+)